MTPTSKISLVGLFQADAPALVWLNNLDSEENKFGGPSAIANLLGSALLHLIFYLLTFLYLCRSSLHAHRTRLVDFLSSPPARQMSVGQDWQTNNSCFNLLACQRHGVATYHIVLRVLYFDRSLDNLHFATKNRTCKPQRLPINTARQAILAMSSSLVRVVRPLTVQPIRSPVRVTSCMCSNIF